MKIFLFDQKVEDDFNQIMQLINLRKNGEVAEMMMSEQNHYKISYGVSVMHLKQICKGYKCGSQLAMRLWFSGVREGMMIATMLVELSEFSIIDCREWIQMIHASELAEMFAQNVLSKTDFGQVVAEELFKSVRVIDLALGLWSIGWMLRLGNDVVGAETERIVLLKLECKHSEAFFLRAFSFLLRQLIRNSDLGKSQVELWLSFNSDSDDYSLKWIIEEVRTELEYR